jgi:uncharacterized protein (DUF2141 family)
MHKVILTFILFLSGVILTQAQEKETHTITVTISGMKSDKGNVYVAIYNSEEDFLNKTFKGAIVKTSDKKATAIFKDIEKGIYAVSVFHDANDNKKMDTNFIGIPKEPTGCSNGATGFMGPPKFKKAKFTVTEDISIPVKVN